MEKVVQKTRTCCIFLHVLCVCFAFSLCFCIFSVFCCIFCGFSLRLGRPRLGEALGKLGMQNTQQEVLLHFLHFLCFCFAFSLRFLLHFFAVSLRLVRRRLREALGRLAMQHKQCNTPNIGGVARFFAFFGVVFAFSLCFLCVWGAGARRGCGQAGNAKNLGGVACLLLFVFCIFFAFVCMFFAFVFAFSLRFLCAWCAGGSERLWESWTCKKPRKGRMVFAFLCFCLHVLCVFVCISCAFSLRFLCVWGAGGSQRLWEGRQCKQRRRRCSPCWHVFAFFAFSMRFLCVGGA